MIDEIQNKLKCQQLYKQYTNKSTTNIYNNKNDALCNINQKALKIQGCETFKNRNKIFI